MVKKYTRVADSYQLPHTLRAVAKFTMPPLYDKRRLDADDYPVCERCHVRLQRTLITVVVARWYVFDRASQYSFYHTFCFPRGKLLPITPLPSPLRLLQATLQRESA